MQIIVRVLSTGDSFLVDVEPNELVQTLVDTIHKRLGEDAFAIRRLLFAGKVLQWDQRLDKYGLQKECVVQVMGRRLVALNDKEEEKSDQNERANNNTDAVVPIVVKKHKGTFVFRSTVTKQPLLMKRQVTDPDVAFGDVIVIKLLEAKALVETNFMSGTSDPYVLFCLGNQMQRSSVKHKQTDPHWNETFCLLSGSPGCEDSMIMLPAGADDDEEDDDSSSAEEEEKKKKKTEQEPRAAEQQKDASLSIMLFSHNYTGEDENLGRCEIDVVSLVRDVQVDVWLPLQDVPTGEVHVHLQRYELLHPDLKATLIPMIRQERSFNSKMWRRHGLALEHLQGKKQFDRTSTVADEQKLGEDVLAMPTVLKHILGLIARGNLDSLLGRGERTLAKIQRILSSNQLTYLSDTPCRSLLITDVKVDVLWSLFDATSRYSEYTMKSFAILPTRDDKPPAVVTCFVVFNSAEAALKAFIHLQTVSQSSTGAGFKCLFTSSPDALFKTFSSSSSSVATERSLPWFFGLLQVSGPHDHDDVLTDTLADEAVWKWRGVLLDGEASLHLFDAMGDKPTSLPPLAECSIVECGPWSFKIELPQQHVSFFFRVTASSVQTDDIIRTFRFAVRTLTRKGRKKNTKKGKKKHKQKHKQQLIKKQNPMMTFRCTTCREDRPIKQYYVVDKKTGTETLTKKKTTDSCRTCIKKRIEETIARDDTKQEQVHEIFSALSAQDMRDILGIARFEHAIDTITKRYVDDHGNAFVTCVNPTCNAVFEARGKDDLPADEEKLAWSRELGLDRRPLSFASQQHFVLNRFRCASCQTVFCKGCGISPYHLGFSCQRYQVYLKADKCRFCSVGLMEYNRLQNPAHAVFTDVCDNEECAAKTEQFCTKHACGNKHPCLGWADEKECPPCLHDCSLPPANGKARPTASAEDLCSICFVDQLSSQPVVMLSSCGHVFHRRCLLQRIETLKPDHRLDFKHTQCPLCLKVIATTCPTITNLLQPWKALYDKVYKLAHERARDRPAMKNRDPMAVYQYYQCHKCKEPFFAGRKECEAAADDDDEKEMKVSKESVKCVSCAGVSHEAICKNQSHKDFILYKCRFCCHPSIWFCFGSTHFCDYCHSHNPWGRAKGNAIGQKERAQCPPPGRKTCPIGLTGMHKNGVGADCELAIACIKCNVDKRSLH